MFRLLTVLMACLLNFTVKAQITLCGRIVDSITHQPLEGASVSEVNNVDNRIVSDQSGYFYFKTNSTDPFLVMNYVGYKTLLIKPGAGDLVFKMQPDFLNLKDVTLQVVSSTMLQKIAKIDLDLKPVRNTQELLRLVPGLFIAQHAGGGKAEQIFLRGFNCDHGTDVDVNFDGMPVNMVSHAHGQGYADSHFIIPETINTIDYGAGPYYTPHGNLNTAGYVSFSTYNNIPQSRIQIEAGRFNTFRTLAMIDLLKRNKDKQSAWLAGDFYYTDGPTVHKQNFNRFNLFGKYNLAVSEHSRLTISGSAFKSKWDASGQIPLRVVQAGIIDRVGSIDPTEGGNTERYNANILLVKSFLNGASWENQAYYSRYLFNLYSDFTFYLNDPINGDEINQAEKRNLVGYLSKLSQKYFLSKGTLTSVYGAGFRDDATKDCKLARVVKRQFLDYIKLGNIDELNSFVYTDQQLNINKWLIDAGVRFDYFHCGYFDKLQSLRLPSKGKSIVSPKLNAQYTINDKVQVYVKTGKGFHSNDTRVVVAEQGKEILPAAYGTDLGMMIKPFPRLFINTAIWYLYLSQEFVYVGDDGNIEPSGKTKRTGIDIILRYQFSPAFFANFNLNLTKPRAIDEPKGENYIPLAPTVTSTGGLFYKSKKGFNGSLTYRYIKERPANENNSIVAKGYFLLDGSLNHTGSKYEIGIALENILNTDWNEAQFATRSRLKDEPSPITELNFTPGNPFFIRLKFAIFF